MMAFWSDAVALAGKDVRTELRTRSALAAALALGAIGILLAALAIGPSPERLRALAPALTWLAFLYAAIAVGDRLDGIDRADDAFSAVWLAVDDRRAIYFGRVLAMTTMLTALLLALWGLSFIVLDVEVGPLLVALPLLLLLSAASVSAGAALVLAMVGAARARALLLPIVLLPLLMPTLVSAVQATESALAGEGGAMIRWVTVLAAQLALFLGIGLLTYEQAAAPE